MIHGSAPIIAALVLGRDFEGRVARKIGRSYRAIHLRSQPESTLKRASLRAADRQRRRRRGNAIELSPSARWREGDRDLNGNHPDAVRKPLTSSMQIDTTSLVHARTRSRDCV